MSSPLSHVPIASRRKLAATLGLFTLLFAAVGAVAATGRGTAAAPIFSAIALIVAVLLGLMTFGIARSIKIDLAEQRLDQAIEDTVAAHGGPAAMCGCGHDHDPSELHVTDCAHDGNGTACEHNCETCVLAAMRPSPSRTQTDPAGG